MINIDYWAKLDLFEDIMEIVQTYRERIQFEDQDVLNILFKEKVFYLPPVYNCIDMLHANCMNAKLLHFASQPKPWSKWWRLNPNCNQHNKDIYQRYENLSGTLYPQTDKYDIKLLMKSLIKFFLYRYLPGRVQKYEM